MHTSTQSPRPDDTAQLLLREAKKLHRASKSNSIEQSLPVLRRLIGNNVIRGLSLPELRRNRDMVQRKHILQMLAAEAGYSSWGEFKRAIVTDTTQSAHYSTVLRQAGGPNLWFSSLVEAKDYSLKNGGKPVQVGQQAVVIPS